MTLMMTMTVVMACLVWPLVSIGRPRSAIAEAEVEVEEGAGGLGGHHADAVRCEEVLRCTQCQRRVAQGVAGSVGGMARCRRSRGAHAHVGEGPRFSEVRILHAQ